MSMKKFITLVVATLMTTIAAADERINTFLFYSPGGTYDRINQRVIVPVLGDRHGKTINIKGCKSIKNYIEKTNEKMFGLWDLENNVPQANGEQNPCYMPTQRMVGVAASMPYYVCHNKGVKNKGLSDFMTNPNIKVGVNGYTIFYATVKDIMNDLNSRARLIPYDSSKAYLPALASGEVDYLFSIQKNDNMTCFASTHDKKVRGMQVLSELSNSVWATRGLLPVFVYKNMTSEEANKLYHEIVNSKEYNSQIDIIYQKPKMINLSRSEQIQILDDNLRDLVKIIR
jgi:tripartite-type tricarboxylate transporter receptor subunit TctC